MSDEIRIVVVGDEGGAKVTQEKLKLKGYTVKFYETKHVVLDGSKLGGHLDSLSDNDGKVFVIIGIKK